MNRPYNGHFPAGHSLAGHSQAGHPHPGRPRSDKSRSDQSLDKGSDKHPTQRPGNRHPQQGRRRHDARSSDACAVTVVDLIRRQQGPVRIPSADERATVEFVDDLLGCTPTEVEQPRGWLSRSAKLAGLALGSLALCGSVYAASTFAHQRQSATPGASAGHDTSVLTGVGALRPDTVAAQLSGDRSGTADSPGRTPKPVPSSSHHASGKATGTILGAPGVATRTSPADTVDDRSPSEGLVSATQVVRTFYQLAATDPRVATRLLTPGLLATDEGGFDRAWSSISKIQVESVKQTSNDTAEAVVRMLEPDGTWLRVVELLHVTGGDAPLISGAKLLSAQRG